MKKTVVLGTLCLVAAAFAGQNQNGQGQNNNLQSKISLHVIQMPEGTAYEIPLVAGAVGVYLWTRYRAARKSKLEKPSE